MTGPVIPIASESSGSNFVPASSTSLPPRPPRNAIAVTPSVVNCITMSLSSASGSLLRACARQQLPTTRAAVTSCQQRRGVADAKSSFQSPFASADERGSTVKIPNFSKYSSGSSPRTNQVFSYFMAGTMGLASAVGAKATVQGTFSLSSSIWYWTELRRK